MPDETDATGPEPTTRLAGSRGEPGPEPGDGGEWSGEEPGIGRKVRRGAWWGVFVQFGQQGLSVVATVVLARLLLPAEFGIIAAANTVIGLVTIGLTLGWSPSVIRHRDPSQAFLSTLFWTATVTASVAAAAAMLLSEPLARLIGVPEAASYLVVVAPTVVLQLAGTVPSALLTRRLHYGQYYLIQLTGMALYVGVQIVLAVLGAGVWSVAVGQLTMSAYLLVAAMVAARWWPRATFSRALLKGEIGFAGGVLGNQVATYGVKNVDYWVVGHALGAGSLGAYYIAYVLPSVLRLRITNVSRRVLLPVFARSRDDVPRRRQVYTEVVRLQAGVGAPMMAVLAVLAGPVIHLFFGAKWVEAVGPLRWISAVAIIDLVGATLAPVAVACGVLGRALVAQLVRMAATAVAVLVAAAVWGTLSSVAAGVLVATVVGAVAQQMIVADRLELGFGLIARDMLSIAAACAVAVLAMLGVDSQLADAPNLARILVIGTAGSLAYVVVGRVVFARTFRPLIRSALRMLRP